MKNRIHRIPIPAFLLFIMRMTFFLFVISILQTYATSSYAQNTHLTIQENEIELGELFHKIEKQTDFYFFYNNDQVNKHLKVTINVKDKTIFEVLDLALKNTGLLYQVHNKAIILNSNGITPSLVQQQKKQITGKITDEQGEPIIGANIIEKETTNGTITNIDGTFLLSVSDSSVIFVSYIGYLSQEIDVGSGNDFQITLKEDLQTLNEVVIVGYGTQRKGLITGSISLTKGEEIIKSPSQNLGQSLQGRIPGVIMNVRSGEPGSDGASISIRGKSTTGNTDPLILVDGIANRSGNWDRINPNDIESITVLKDASAAIYGSRSANGVILITTKRGKEGKPTIDYSYNIGFQQPTRLPQLADAATFAEVFNEIEEYEGRIPRYTVEEIEKFRNGSDPVNYPNTDWLKETLRKTSLQQKHNVSLRGGNDRIKYFVGAGFADQDAIYKNSNTFYRQYNIRSNIDAQITKYLSASVDLAGRIEDQQYSGYDAGTIFFSLLRSFPTSLARYPNGFPTVGMDIGNPVTLVTDETGYRRYNKSVFNSTFMAKLDLSWLIEGLSIDGYMAFDKEGMEKKEWKIPFYYYVWDQTTDTYEKKKTGPGIMHL